MACVLIAHAIASRLARGVYESLVGTRLYSCTPVNVSTIMCIRMHIVYVSIDSTGPGGANSARDCRLTRGFYRKPGKHSCTCIMHSCTTASVYGTIIFMYAHANNEISCVYISDPLGVAVLIAHAIASRLTRGVYESLVSVPYNSGGFYYRTYFKVPCTCLIYIYTYIYICVHVHVFSPLVYH
jgi:hypothetical protein